MSLKAVTGQHHIYSSWSDVCVNLLLLLPPAGSCSPVQTDAILHLRPETSISCHVSFTSDAIDFPAERVFTTRTAFEGNAGKELLFFSRGTNRSPAPIGRWICL